MRWAAMAMAPPFAHNLAATEQMAAAAAAGYTTLEPAPRGWDHGLHTLKFIHHQSWNRLDMVLISTRQENIATVASKWQTKSMCCSNHRFSQQESRLHSFYEHVQARCMSSVDITYDSLNASRERMMAKFVTSLWGCYGCALVRYTCIAHSNSSSQMANYLLVSEVRFIF